MATSRLTPELGEAGQQPAAIVLVGGRSSRMGTDKASLVVDGLSMRDRVLAAVAEAGIDTVVVAGAEHGSQGPLDGITGAWHSLLRETDVAADPVVVLACDLPWLVADVITDLVQASGEHAHGAVAHDGERAQPLVAAYRPAALEAMTACFTSGERSIRRCSMGWDLGVVNADPAVIADADTPDDLEGFVVQWPL